MNRLLLGVFIVGMCAGSGSGVQVSLRNGSRIQAPLLKNDDTAVVIDLGFDVLRIPAQRILSVTDDVEKQGGKKISREYYTEAEMQQVPTVAAARKYAPAVVVVKSPNGLGSGFFVNKEGYLITNFHVVKGSRHFTVTRFKQERGRLKRVIYRDVEIVATAPFHDLAVLKIKEDNDELTSVVLSPNDHVDVGETVFAIGNPLGLERSVTEGVISQAARNFQGFLYLQVDAPVNPGNSGGPLFNSRGEVIGVINMGIPSMEGLNFAIPVMHVKYVLDHLSGFAFNQSNPESGYVYPEPPPKPSEQQKKDKESKKDATVNKTGRKK